MILLHLQFNKHYQNDLLMQMEYQRKKESSELQQAQRELGTAKVYVTHVQTHTMTYMCTRMHACRDILATCTPSTESLWRLAAPTKEIPSLNKCTFNHVLVPELTYDSRHCRV